MYYLCTIITLVLHNYRTDIAFWSHYHRTTIALSPHYIRNVNSLSCHYRRTNRIIIYINLVLLNPLHNAFCTANLYWNHHKRFALKSMNTSSRYRFVNSSPKRWLVDVDVPCLSLMYPQHRIQNIPFFTKMFMIGKSPKIAISQKLPKFKGKFWPNRPTDKRDTKVHNFNI